MLKPVLTSLALLAAAASSAHAEQSAASAAAKGRVAPLGVQLIGQQSAAETKAFTTKASAIIDKALSTPTLNQPRGFSITRSLTIDTPPSEQPQSNPYIGRATMILQMIDIEGGSKADASGAYMGRLEGPGMNIRFNNLAAIYANSGGGGGMSEPRYLPMKMQAIQGFPVFKVGLNQVIVVAKPGRLPYVPMTKAEYLQHLATEIDDPKLAADLAALSPAERNAPACVSSRLSQRFGECAEKDATYYVRLNPNYFDKGARKGAIQLVTISTPIPGGHGHKILEPKLKAAASEIDLKSIQAMLD